MGGKNSPESINRYMAKAYDRINIISSCFFNKKMF